MQNNVQDQKKYSTAWISLLALLTALGPLSIDMYLPALPQMANDFGVSTQMMSNTLPAYFLGLAVGQLIYGPVSDRIGRKKPLYFGLSLYILASVICYLSQDEWSLIAARILQALGGCVGVVIARAAIRDKLDMQASAQAFSSMMIVMGIAPIIAPTLGAWVLNFFSWHAIFGFLAIIGAVSLVCVHLFFKETLPEERRLDLNLIQAMRLYGVVLRDKSFLMPMLIGCFSGGILFCYINSSASVLIEHFAMSQQAFAYAFGFNAFGIMLLSTMNNRLVGHVSVFSRLLIGLTIQLLGVILLLSIAILELNALLWVLIGLFMTVAGIGFTGPNAMAIAMSHQGERAGTASALMGSMQFGCGLLGGIMLNILAWSAMFNMGLVMLLFVLAAIAAFIWTRLSSNLQTS